MTRRFGRGNDDTNWVAPGEAKAAASAQDQIPEVAMTHHDGYAPVTYPWAEHSQEDLLKFLDEIKRHLPPMSLSGLNLEEELILQLYTVRNLQTKVMETQGIAANQRAQVANAVAAALNKLIEHQQAVYTSERFKRIEGLLIRWLSAMPEDVAESYIKNYEELLRDL